MLLTRSRKPNAEQQRRFDRLMWVEPVIVTSYQHWARVRRVVGSSGGSASHVKTCIPQACRASGLVDRLALSGVELTWTDSAGLALHRLICCDLGECDGATICLCRRAKPHFPSKQITNDQDCFLMVTVH
jgi:hypothetical protein